MRTLLHRPPCAAITRRESDALSWTVSKAPLPGILPVKAKILILHGAEDPLIKEEQIQAYVSAMEASGLDWQMVFYGGAKHSFTNPDADKVGMDALG